MKTLTLLELIPCLVLLQTILVVVGDVSINDQTLSKQSPLIYKLNSIIYYLILIFSIKSDHFIIKAKLNSVINDKCLNLNKYIYLIIQIICVKKFYSNYIIIVHVQ